MGTKLTTCTWNNINILVGPPSCVHKSTYTCVSVIYHLLRVNTVSHYLCMFLPLSACSRSNDYRYNSSLTRFHISAFVANIVDYT